MLQISKWLLSIDSALVWSPLGVPSCAVMVRWYYQMEQGMKCTVLLLYYSISSTFHTENGRHNMYTYFQVKRKRRELEWHHRIPYITFTSLNLSYSDPPTLIIFQHCVSYCFSPSLFSARYPSTQLEDSSTTCPIPSLFSICFH
jgi:hypothetical protein